MITVTPQSTIHLCKTKLHNDYNHQIKFADRTAQTNYFNSTKVQSFADYTYTKKDNTIKVNASIDDIIDCDYLYYTNNGFTSKTYYCFINNMRYINENVTEISFETDCWQTWQFAVDTTKRSFVEREHVNDDTIGANTVPETIETGEYIVNGTPVNKVIGKPDYYIIAAVSDLNPINVPEGFNNVTVYGGVYSGLTYLVLENAQYVPKLTKAYDRDSKADAINSIFMVPKNIFLSTDISWQNQGSDTWRAGFLAASFSSVNLGDFSITRPGTLDGYSPVNNKLHTYPFSYFYMTNNTGGDIEFRWEDFSTATPTFSIKGTPNPGCSLKAIPRNYKRTDDAYNYGMTGAKLPVCGWNSDAYTNWLSQNGLNIGYQAAIGAASGLASAASMAAVGGPAGAAAGAAIGIAKPILDAIMTVDMHSRVPDQAKGNTNTSDVNYASNKSGYTIYPMSVRREFAIIADNYMSMFGYKVNRLKVPNLTGRRNWNYVKTIDCNFDGDIPPEDLSVIRKAFDKGITLWHNPATMLDYSQNNSII